MSLDERLQVVVLFDLGFVDDDTRRRRRGEKCRLGISLCLIRHSARLELQDFI